MWYNYHYQCLYSNGTSSSGKQQAITSKTSQQLQQLVNGNSAIELYPSKNSCGGSDGPLLPGSCDLCDGKNSELNNVYKCSRNDKLLSTYVYLMCHCYVSYYFDLHYKFKF